MITLKDIRKAHPGVASTTDKDCADIANTVEAMLRYTPFGAERSEEERAHIEEYLQNAVVRKKELDRELNATFCK